MPDLTDDQKAALKTRFRSCGKRQSEIAALVKRSPGAISQWVNGERPIPADIVPQVESVTGIPRHEIRPDLWSAPSESLVAA
jgi:DNA-binding transcriptional regulator YdaS (Cro superfamily)